MAIASVKPAPPGINVMSAITDAMVKYGGIAMVGTALAAGLQYALRIRDVGK